jgi:DNA-directed RNA polymerase subunit RPC12/RpoP
MNHYKYACPFCGQRIDYTDGYAGQQMPCPQCQNPIVFPAVPASKATSSLRLVRDIPTAQAQTRFSFAGLAAYLKEFKHWKIAAMCAAPFAAVLAALVVAAEMKRHEPEPAEATAPQPATVDPKELGKLTELTRADMLVQDQVKAVNRAGAASENRRRLHLDGQAEAEEALANARKRFEAAYAKYQQLGGTVDYRRQIQ